MDISLCDIGGCSTALQISSFQLCRSDHVVPSCINKRAASFPLRAHCTDTMYEFRGMIGRVAGGALTVTQRDIRLGCCVYNAAQKGCGPFTQKARCRSRCLGKLAGCFSGAR